MLRRLDTFRRATSARRAMETRPRTPIRTRRSAQRPRSSPSRWIPLGADQSRASYWPGGNPKVSPKVNRRELLAGGSVLGAAAAISALGAPAQAGRVELGRFTRREGVHGKMTGAQAAAAALCCQGVPLRLRNSRRPEQRILGRLESQGRALSARRARGLGQRDGRRLGAGHRHRRSLLRRARTRA